MGDEKPDNLEKALEALARAEADRARYKAAFHDLETKRLRQAAEVEAAHKRAEEGEESHPGRVALEKERQALLEQIVKERQAHRDTVQALLDRIEGLQAGRPIPDPAPTVRP